MQTNSNGMPCEGATVCGTLLRPCDEDSQYGIVRRPGFTCGFTVETGNANPYLRLTPAVQVPRFCRDGYERWQFEHDDDQMMDLVMDKDDGELRVRYDLRGTRVEDFEPLLNRTVDWLEKTAVPQVRAYIRSCYQSE